MSDRDVTVGLAFSAFLGETVDPEDKNRCDLCGEPIDWASPLCEAAEMYDPEKPDEDSVICHGECGLNAGLSVA